MLNDSAVLFYPASSGRIDGQWHPGCRRGIDLILGQPGPKISDISYIGNSVKITNGVNRSVVQATIFSRSYENISFNKEDVPFYKRIVSGVCVVTNLSNRYLQDRFFKS